MSNVFSDFTDKCEQNLSAKELEIINSEIINIVSQEEIEYSSLKISNNTFKLKIDLNDFFDKILNRLMKESSISSKLRLLS
tara:strand:+ start:286 stop:528 length:243 start_codon:yes stop_codon:yes gene_type:complete